MLLAAVDRSLLALAVVAGAVGALDDAGRARGLLLACLGRVGQDEQDSGRQEHKGGKRVHHEGVDGKLLL